MDWQGPGFIIAIIAITTIGYVLNSWTRAKHGYPLEDEWWSGKSNRHDMDADANRKIELLANESGRLIGQVGRLEERIAVLERIITDRATSLATEIENLR